MQAPAVAGWASDEEAAAIFGANDEHGLLFDQPRFLQPLSREDLHLQVVLRIPVSNFHVSFNCFSNQCNSCLLSKCLLSVGWRFQQVPGLVITYLLRLARAHVWNVVRDIV